MDGTSARFGRQGCAQSRQGPDDWSYAEAVSRNIGLVSPQQQQRLRQTRVAVLGVGGIGGVVAELLARSGVGRLTLVDFDTFETSNLNRQIFANRDALGREKIDVAQERLAAVMPEIELSAYATITEGNAGQVLAGCDVVVLAIDEVAPCIAAARQAEQMGIPQVEGWAIPYANVRVIDSTTPTLEQLYDLPTRDRPLSSFSAAELSALTLQVIASLAQVEGLTGFYAAELRGAVAAGQAAFPSFAPMVWIAAALMANETIKVILDWHQIARAPRWALYDPYSHRIPTQQGGK